MVGACRRSASRSLTDPTGVDVGLELLGSALKLGAAAKPTAVRILSGKTATEDAALRSLIQATLRAAVEHQGGPAPVAEVLFRPFQSNGTLRFLIGEGQARHGIIGAEQAWSGLLSRVIAEQDAVDLKGLDTVLLCRDFAERLWRGIQDDATLHGSPLANLANRLQLAQLVLHDREGGPSVSGRKPSGLQVALPKQIFVGRDTEVSKLDERTDPGGAVIVTGRPGVGKSELAAQWTAGHPTDTRWWIDASTLDSFHVGVNELAMTLGRAGSPNVEQTLNAVLSTKGLCLVLDDAIPEVIAATVSHDVVSRVVVTTISASPEYSTFVFELSPLDHKSLMTLAGALVPRLPTADAARLVELFEGQPLGVRQAAPLVDLMGLERLVRILEQSPAAAQRMGRVVGRRENLAALWEHSLGRSHGDIDDRGRRALSLLHVLGGFEVPLDLFFGSVAVELAEEGEDLADETDCWRLIAAWRDLRLVDIESGWVRAHGLLRDYCWDTLDEDRRRHAVASAIEALAQALRSARIAGEPRQLILLDFVSNVSLLVDMRLSAPGHLVSMMRWSLNLALLHGQRELGLSVVDRTLATATQTAGDPELILELVNLKLHALESLDSPQSRSVIDDYSSRVDEISSLSGRCAFHSLAARALLRFDETDLAKAHAAAALELAQAESGSAERDDLLALAHHANGFVKARLGDTNVADDHMRRSSESIAKVDGSALAGLEIAQDAADLFERLGQVEKAGFWRDILLAQAESGPPEAKYQVAIILGEAGRLREACALLEKYVHDLSLFDSDSSTLRKAEALNAAGRLCLDNHHVADAKPYLKRALDLLSEIGRLESSVPHHADVLDNLAHCALADRDYPRAAALAVQAMKLDAAHYGRDHHEYASDLITLALAQFELGLIEPALQRLRQAIAIWERPGASQHLDLLSRARKFEQDWLDLLTHERS